MKWQIVINDRAIEIDPDHLELVRQVEPGVYSVLLDGVSYEARTAPSEEGLAVQVNGRRFSVEVRDPRNASRRSRSAVGAGRQNIAAPMPGKVVRVLVKQGDAVDTGQGLAVVEAMKMQNEMKAARPGHVAEVRVRDGDTVAANQVLLVLE